MAGPFLQVPGRYIPSFFLLPPPCLSLTSVLSSSSHQIRAIPAANKFRPTNPAPCFNRRQVMHLVRKQSTNHGCPSADAVLPVL
eukprot:103776-Rhodomonas_salina.1